MVGLQRLGWLTESAICLAVLLGLPCLLGCEGPQGAANNQGESANVAAGETPDQPEVAAPSTADDEVAKQPKAAVSESDGVSSDPEAVQTEGGTEVQPTAPVPADADPLSADTFEPPSDRTGFAEDPAPVVTPVSLEGDAQAEADEAEPSLDELLAKLEIPPPWLESVETSYDTSHPWKDARLEIRRLLGIGKPETHREAIKLTWIYLQKDDINDGHEYPMYTFLGGEPVWSIRAHEWYLAKPHDYSPIHAYITLASLYQKYGEFEKAKATLDRAMADLPKPPWRIMRNADLSAAYGDLYAAWGKIDEAKKSYAEAAALYPTAKPPYGGHLLPRRAAAARSKLDLLTFRSLDTASLRDGQYRETALGYAGDVHVTVTIRGGRIADIQVKHEEKIDQNASVIIPERIIQQQSLQVDGVTGATVTTSAIVDGVYQALKKAGLQ